MSSGEGHEVHRIQGIREDALWEDLHLGLLDPGDGEEGKTNKQEGSNGRRRS